MLKRLLTRIFGSGRRAEGRYRRATRARERGDMYGAIRLYRGALALQPDYPEAQNDLGIALVAVGDMDGAREAFLAAAGAKPGLVSAHVNLAHLLREQFHDYSGATDHYRAALAHDDTHAEVWNGLGLALSERGMAEPALACFREALARAPTDAAALTHLLFVSNALPQRDLDHWFAEHRRWAQLHADSVPQLPPAPASAGDRLKIGYVSADFREHATARFMLPLLKHHNRKAFEVYCYSNSTHEDDITREMRRHAAAWRTIDGLSDGSAARTIRADAVDILVDLSGHTRGHRLGVFACRPARLQLSYLGYLNTTGMRAMDCRLSDALADPPGASERYHSEQLLRLARTMWCYEPYEDAPEVAPAPVQRKGFVTFGSFNHPLKLSRPVLELWARLLEECVEAQLIIMPVPDAGAAEAVGAPFAERGIESARLRMLPRAGRSDFWQVLSQVDIALDSFPYNGGATTCDCLWMGIPVVTLAGAFGFARSGASILTHARLPDCIAQSRDEYLAIATRLASDAGGLARLRAQLRDRLRAAPLLDAGGFVRDLENAYRTAWQSLA